MQKSLSKRGIYPVWKVKLSQNKTCLISIAQRKKKDSLTKQQVDKSQQISWGHHICPWSITCHLHLALEPSRWIQLLQGHEPWTFLSLQLHPKEESNSLDVDMSRKSWANVQRQGKGSEPKNYLHFYFKKYLLLPKDTLNVLEDFQIF